MALMGRGEDCLLHEFVVGLLEAVVVVAVVVVVVAAISSEKVS